jgi:(p)ppGpp synthase/HD superfamily hydrolase
MTTLVARARAFATAAHAEVNQKRKYTGEDYIVHPMEVAAIVATVPHTEEMLAAAWLHDTVEDTNATIKDVRECFGDIVADMVADLTDVSTPGDGNRAVRKAKDLAHTAHASRGAKTVKLADLLSNTKSIVEHDASFAKVYLREKSAMLDVLGEGDATLHARAVKALTDSILLLTLGE